MFGHAESSDTQGLNFQMTEGFEFSNNLKGFENINCGGGVSFHNQKILPKSMTATIRY